MIEPIHNVVNVTHRQQTVERVYKTTDGDHKVEKTIYHITLYDSNGVLKTVTNSHKIDYVI